MVEWLEELNPTDEDEEKYREFRLSGFNPELCSIFNRDCVRGLISICVRIGLLKITNPNYSIGYFGKGYIYSPAVGAILEDLLILSKIPVKRRRNYTPVETWEAQGKRLYGVRWMFSGNSYAIPDLPAFEELKSKLGKLCKKRARTLLHLFQNILEYTASPVVENGKALEFFYKTDKHIFGKKEAEKLGLLINTSPPISSRRPKGYVMNPAIIPLLEEIIAEKPPTPIKPPKAPKGKASTPSPYPTPLGKDEAREAPFSGYYYPDLFPPPDVETLKAAIGYEESDLRWYMKAGLLINVGKRLEELKAVE